MRLGCVVVVEGMVGREVAVWGEQSAETEQSAEAEKLLDVAVPPPGRADPPGSPHSPSIGGARPRLRQELIPGITSSGTTSSSAPGMPPRVLGWAPSSG
jgi:hypothetical protein